jgi:hypothetical protein
VWFAPYNADRVLSLTAAPSPGSPIESSDGIASSGTVARHPITDSAGIVITANNRFPDNSFPVTHSSKFGGAVYDAAAERVWLIPIDATQILSVERRTGEMNGFRPTSGVTFGSSRYRSGALIGDTLFLCPYLLPAVPVVGFNVRNYTMTSFSGWPHTASIGFGEFAGAASDGERMWMYPFTGSTLVAMVARGPQLGNMTAYSAWPYTIGSTPFGGGVYDGHGTLWLIPLSQDAVTSVDTTSGTMRGFTAFPPGFQTSWNPTIVEQFRGGCYGSQRIWMAPNTATHVVSVDRTTGYMEGFNTWPAGFINGTKKFGSATFDGQRVWMTPQQVNMIVALDTDTGVMSGYDAWPNGFTKRQNSDFTASVFDGTHVWFVPASAASVLVLGPAVQTRSATLPTTATIAVYGGDGIGFSGVVRATPLGAQVEMTDLTGFAAAGIALGGGNNAFGGGVYDTVKNTVWMIPRRASHLVESSAAGIKGHDGWPLGVVRGTQAFVGGALFNRTLLLAPHDANAVVSVNVDTGNMTKYDDWASIGITKVTGAFFGAVSDGERMWMLPSAVAAVVSVDHRSGAMSAYTAWPNGVPVARAYRGGIFDGRHVWMVPYRSPELMTIDTVTKQIVRLWTGLPPGVTASSDAFVGGAFDGSRVWLAPYRATHVVSIEAVSKTVASYNTWPQGFLPNGGFGTSLFHTCCFDGRRVWMTPSSSPYLVAIDPDTGAMSSHANWPSGYTKSGWAFSSIVFDGDRLWLLPHSADRVVVVSSPPTLSPSRTQQPSTTVTPTHAAVSTASATRPPTATRSSSLAVSRGTPTASPSRSIPRPARRATGTSTATAAPQCDALSAAECPAASCRVVGGTCIYAPCPSYTAADCADVPGCDVSASTGSCEPATSPCEQFSQATCPPFACRVVGGRCDYLPCAGYNTTQCGAVGGCRTDNATAACQPFDPQCGRYAQADCPPRQCRVVGSTCVELPCAWYNSTQCGAVAGCVAVDATGSCEPDAPHCDTRNVSHCAVALPLRCELLNGTTCKPMPCAAYSSTLCPSIPGCAVDDLAGACQPDVPTCSAATAGAACPSPQCEWIPSGAAPGACIALPCGSYNFTQCASVAGCAVGVNSSTVGMCVAEATAAPTTTQAPTTTEAPTTAVPAARTVTASRSLIVAAAPLAAVIPEPEVITAGVTVAVTGSIGALANPAAALQVTRAMALMALASCERDHEARLSFPLSVLPSFGFGPRVGRYARGAVVANVASLPIFCVLAVVAGLAFMKIRKQQPTLVLAARLTRFPGSLALAFAFVAGGTAMAAASAASHGAWLAVDVPLAIVAGALAVGSIVGAVAVIHRSKGVTVLHKPSYLAYREKAKGHDPGEPVFADQKTIPARAATLLLFGTAAWVPCMDKDGGQVSYVMEHFGILLSRYHNTGLAPYFFAVEMIVTVLVSITAGLVPADCQVLSAVVAALCGCMLFMTLAVRPYNVPVKNALCTVSDAMTCTAAVMVAASIPDKNEQLARDATRLALAAVNVTMVSCGFSAVRFVVMHLKHCRMTEGAPDARLTQPLLTMDDYEMVRVDARAVAQPDPNAVGAIATDTAVGDPLDGLLDAAPAPAPTAAHVDALAGLGFSSDDSMDDML